MYTNWKAVWTTVLGCLAVGLGTVLAFQAPERPSSEGWKQVEESINNGLPKTAIDQLKPIIDSATQEKRYAEAIKGIARRVQLETQIAGGRPESSVTKLSQAIETVPEEMKPVMHVLIGHAYWNYFQANRWQFAQRTTTSGDPGDDFTTWDLKHLFAQIDKSYSAALAAEEQLKAIPIADYDDLLTKGTLPDSYRPTLFDFVAFEALNFYSSGEQAGAKAQDAFEFEFSSPALGSTEEFLAWAPTSTDEESVKLKAIRLYQKLLANHAGDEDKSAFLDAELSRLQFAHANGVGEEGRNRYVASLRRFASENIKHELSSVARYRWALLLVQDEDFVEARKIAQEGAQAHPESVGGRQCENLIRDIESKSLQITTERVWGAPPSQFRATYKNLTKVYFRVHKINWRDAVTNSQNSPQYISKEQQDFIDQSPPAKQWSVDLPATPDFSLTSHDFDVPKDLAPGFYYVQASGNESFTDTDNVVATAGVWVSNLALVVNQAWNSDKVQGLVLNNESGTPIANAKVTAFVIDRGGRRGTNITGSVTEQSVNTNHEGKFEIQVQDRNFLLLAEHGGHSLAIRDNLYVGRNDVPNETRTECVLFTDRSIFRPGQQVHFKGVCTFSDPKQNQYRVVPNHAVNVTFHDTNGNVIESQSLRSNDFGSFSGTFTIPRGRGTGSMSIQVAGMTSTHVQVEEYKRPKFTVELESPADSPRLNDELVVRGKAKSYTGVSIQNAKVSYRVRRTVRWPIWFSYCFPWRIPVEQSGGQELAHGIVTTDTDGNFEVKFTAKPDRAIEEDTNPIFTYEVIADVTDSTGETRSDTYRMSVGYVALEANVSASNEWLTTDAPVVFDVATNSLNGEPIPAAGQLKLYRLVEPSKVVRPENFGGGVIPMPRRARSGSNARIAPPVRDFTNLANWEQGPLVSEHPFDWKKDSKRQLSVKLERGSYRAVVETKDRFGKPVQAITHVIVIDSKAKELGVKIPSYFRAEKWSLQPGETFRGVWATGYESGRAFIQILSDGKLIKEFWTDEKTTLTRIELPITEELRGGATIRAVYVRENRSYIESRQISVPWTNKELTLKWERLVSKLEPGVKEKFKITVQGPKAEKAVAELVAGMYDASLDAYLPHRWMNRFSSFRTENSWSNWAFHNNPEYLNPIKGQFRSARHSIASTYRQLDMDLGMMGGYGGRMMMRGMGGMGGGMAMSARAQNLSMPAPASAPMEVAESMSLSGAAADFAFAKSEASQTRAAFQSDDGGEGESGAGPNVDLESVSPRRNLQETAFFLPHVSEGKDGSFELEFVVPEALTSWRVMAFAHDRELRSGYLDAEVVTKKDLMVEPNPPRFLREGDVIEFSVKVSNTSDTVQTGKVALKLSSAITDKSVDGEFGNEALEQVFELKPEESKGFSWRIKVPDGSQPIIYRAIGATAKVSDGEEGMLPVLSKRILVTESLPLPIRGATTKEFELKSLLGAADSDTLKHQSLTVQMVSQPAWYAVLSLPYLMEYPYDCSEQVFNRLYANSLASHIAQSDPKIRRVLNVWKELQPDALVSPLEKNQDIKSVLIEETPWLRDAQKETEARRNVGLLFDEARLQSETQRAMQQLSEMQNGNGMWPWFPGGPDNEYLSLYIVTGFGRLQHLGVAVDTSPAMRALQSLDSWIRSRHEHILAHTKNPEENHLGSTICLYLYGRSFFLNQLPVAPENQEAFQYWVGQAKKYWLSQPRQSQAQLALALKRLDDKETPAAILKSIVEFSTTNEEMGMFWEAQSRSWWWYEAPIETQAILIEALDEVAKDANSVEECKVWLLKQKQTQNWKTTKSTADAIYALLLRGTSLLASDELVAVELGGQAIEPKNVEAGTGFYEEKFVRGEIKPEMGKVRVTKKDEGVSWGSLHWQYLEDVSKVKAYDGTPLKLEKKLFKKVDTKSGPSLEELKGPVEVGDELVSRIVLRVDRDMEYIHLKDQRGSGTEPVNVLSGYRRQDSLWYYESTRDTATHFFVDYLPKGTYVFEYSVRVQHAGEYPSGIASIESMYAPEFNSHSGSVPIQAKRGE